MNTNFSMHYWVSLGARKDQLLVGIGLYGRGFKLCDPHNHNFYACASAAIEKANYTRTDGFWGYNEFCEKMMSEGDEWNIYRVRKHDISS